MHKDVGANSLYQPLSALIANYCLLPPPFYYQMTVSNMPGDT